MDHAREMQAELLTPQAVLYPALSCAEVGQVTAPTLLLTGELSPRLFHRITDELDRCLPHAERVMLAGVSHGLKNNVEAYNATVLAFLARHADEF
jgi:pimeloyl-ACP methyl ester carboxylesterase